ncbi:MAG: hypothetical protein ACI4TD_01560 [Phocaeicola sp.]
MKVKIKKFSDNAVVPFKTYDSDFCYDVVATSEDEIAPNVWKYGIGWAFEVIDGCDFDCIRHSIDFRPRSSVWKTGMILSSCTGTIDKDFRGEVSAVFYHVLPNMPRYKVGDKIGQIKFNLTETMDFVESDALSETDRGIGSYGSTGK